MLKYGFQALHGFSVLLPRRPEIGLLGMLSINQRLRLELYDALLKKALG